MTDLIVRRMRFNFASRDVPFVWNPQSPAFSCLANAVSIMAVAFEKMIVDAVREAMPLITDAGIKSEADAFLRQEAQHASAHRQHLRALVKQYPGLQGTFDAAISQFDQLTETAPLKFRLAYIADLEATFTPTFKMMLDNEDTLFRPGDDRVASLFLWHFVEEVEHRSSALIIYDAVVPTRSYRMRALPGVAKHIGRVLGIILDGFNAQVPEADRLIDARMLSPIRRTKDTLRRRLPFVSTPSGTPVAGALKTVPWREQAIARLRSLLSQLPHHKPADEPLPAFADEWFHRYAGGYDVTQWYTAATAN